MRNPIVGVMGAGDRATAAEMETAYRLGQHIARQGWTLLTGGRQAGVMDAASRGAKSANGLTIGILPGTDDTDVSAAVDIAIYTGMGNARNMINVLTSDVIMVCGMGSGTASEVALALKVEKPVVLLNASRESRAFFSTLSNRVQTAESIAEAIALAYTALNSEQQRTDANQ